MSLSREKSDEIPLVFTIISEVVVYTIYYILERYVDRVRNYDCIGGYDRNSSCCIYYIIERYINPTRDYNRDRRLRLCRKLRSYQKSYYIVYNRDIDCTRDYNRDR